MTTCSVEAMNTAQANARRDELIKGLPDLQHFMYLGDTFQLDSEERVIYNELLDLEFLVG